MTACEPTTSGRTFVVGAVVAALLLVAAILVLGPVLRTATFGRATAPGTRETIAAGEVDGRRWEAVATDDENGVCVSVAFPPLRQRGTCALTNDEAPLQALRVVTSPASRSPVVMAVLGPHVAAVRYDLASGAAVTVDVAETDARFPVRFAVAPLPADVEVEAVVALDRAGTELDRGALPVE